jgi:hypothetical protein
MIQITYNTILYVEQQITVRYYILWQLNKQTDVIKENEIIIIV